jgi:putative oxidoreductase
MGKRLQKIEPYLYTIAKILVGFFIFMHGSSKLGWFTGKAGMAVGSLMWFVGIFEILVGVLIIIGLLTRLAALTGIIIVLSAYFKAHAPKALNPMANGGELALLFLAAFILILIYGSGKYGLEHCIRKKECI